MDLAVYRAATGIWYIALSSTEFATYGEVTLPVPWGGWPLPADYDGDGRADPAAVASSNRRDWDIRFSSGDGDVSRLELVGFYLSAALRWFFAVGDYDGDGRADPAVCEVHPLSAGRPDPYTCSAYLSSRDFKGGWGIRLGLDVAPIKHVVGDFDGDGRVDPTFVTHYYPSYPYPYMNNPQIFWRTVSSSLNYTTEAVLQWGVDADIPVALDYDGDGVTDVAMYRPSAGTWYLRNQFWLTWGTVGDIPIVEHSTRVR